METASLSALTEADLAEFEDGTRQFLRQRLDSASYTPMRTRNGVYATREINQYMVRIKVPAGVMTARQLRTVADVLDDYSTSRRAHITTRQDLQLYHLKLDFVPRILRDLTQAGMTTRQAGGNAVRNIKCCPYAGIHPQAPFDPTPYARALADYFLRTTEPIEVAPGIVKSFAKLPRKFKISFGGCCADDDCGQANINDLGFLAATQRTPDGKTILGFAIKAGGGLSIAPREALLLKDFIPADELIPWAQAVLRVFMLHGHYDSASAGRKTRLKHLIEEKGWDFFRNQVFAMRQSLPQAVALELDRFREPAPVCLAEHANSKSASEPNPHFVEWIGRATRSQRNNEYVSVTIKAPLEDFSSIHLRAIADAADIHGNGEGRLSDAQAIVLRHVHSTRLKALFTHLVESGLSTAPVAPQIITASCPGVETCRIGVTSSRDLIAVVERWLESIQSTLQADSTIGPLNIRASGCPNGCGQHAIATIGFHGAARSVRVDGAARQVPMAVMYIGGSSHRTAVQFARKFAEIPVCRVTEALNRIFIMYLDHRVHGQSFLRWAQHVNYLAIHNEVFDLAELDPTDESIFFDAGHQTPFRVIPAGGGQCGT